MARVKNSAVVARQLPEHIREDYPTFVAFVEAYYEFLQTQGVDFSTIRDIDSTLENFVVYFKKELAYNLPNVTQDERFLLQKIKDQYLAKGSEGSYKLLFRLLYGKDVEVFYPGRQMLRVSDGRWNQELSVFAKVDFGNPDEIIGKLVDIQTAGRILRVLVDKKQDLIGEIDRIVLIDPTLQIYEFFLDKRFFGNINPGDRIRYLDRFQATILPATKNISITQEGKNFRPGQVFELRSGNGTGAFLKVNEVTPTGGIKYAELIKFGIGYTANFALGILASNTVTSRGVNVTSSSTLIQDVTYSSDTIGAISWTQGSKTVTGSGGASFGGVGQVKVGDEIFTESGDYVGVVKEIVSSTELTLQDNAGSRGWIGTDTSGSNDVGTSGTNQTYIFRNNNSVGDVYEYDLGGETYQGEWTSSSLIDRTVGFNEQGYVNLGDYVDYQYVDGTYAGSLIREFTLNFRNAQVESDEPAIINVTLGALVRYPGYFETNNGFLDDSIYIQDSRYYQAFSYVLKIDERLDSYSSAVKTMLHPAGMALFGEFNITNEYDLSVALESLVKSLGIGLEDEVVGETDLVTKSVSKALSSSINTPIDSTLLKFIGSALATSLSAPTDAAALQFTKSLTSSIDTPEDDSLVLEIGKSLTTSYSGSIDSISKIDVDKVLSDIPVVTESIALATDKYVDVDTLDDQEHEGYVQINSYYGQDYIVFEDEYSVGSRESTFTTP